MQAKGNWGGGFKGPYHEDVIQKKKISLAIVPCTISGETQDDRMEFSLDNLEFETDNVPSESINIIKGIQDQPMSQGIGVYDFIGTKEMQMMQIL